MAIQKRTLVDQVEVTRNGIIGIRLLKQVVDENNVILVSKYHRTCVPPGVDPKTQLAVVNMHLQNMGMAPVSDAEWERVQRISAVEHTADVIAAYTAAQIL